MNKHIINELRIFAAHLSLLIVEDQEDLGGELMDFFKQIFKNVSYAKNGEIALNMYKKSRYDIVITDLNMPKMDGIELSKNIRILNKEQTIIVLSGYIDDYVVDLIDIGVQALVIKPYVLDKFLHKILQLSENIVLKKAFNKMKLSKSSENDNNNLQPKLLVVNSIAQKIVDSRKEELPTMSVEKKVVKYENKKAIENIGDTMWKHIKEDILELNYEYEDVINSILLRGFNEEAKENLVKIFDKYYSNLSMLSNLHELAMIFFELRELMNNLNLNEINNESMAIFDILEFFYEDIINFFKVVFIDKEAKDMNYLTDSLRSSVDQMKFNLGLTNLEDDELELF